MAEPETAEVHDTRSPEATEALGARLAAELRPGDVVLVSGELGAGKTTFVRGACRGLGVTGPVTSPTFTIGRRYQGGVPVAHVDLYRVENPQHEDPGLLADYLAQDAVAFVEWPEHADPGVGPVAAHVRLEHAGGDRRRVTIRRP